MLAYGVASVFGCITLTRRNSTTTWSGIYDIDVRRIYHSKVWWQEAAKALATPYASIY